MSPFLVASGLLALLAFSAALDPTLDTAWEDWKSLHGKEYLEGEEASRRAVWEDNWRMIEKHNLEASQGKHTYWLGMNHFGDLTSEEFNQRTGCFLPDEAEPPMGNVSFFNGPATWRIPKSVDWRQKGYVSPVKQQGNCGSCWAFAATGALENLYFKRTGKRVPLSEQHLVDCSGNGNHGCQGGTASAAFHYVKQRGGLPSARDYPYRGKNGRCRANARKIRIPIKQIERVNTERGLERAVVEYGPVSVNLNFNSARFQFYHSGVFRRDCGRGKRRHIMLVVGYGETKPGQKYWIIKNSWSEKWGDKGYLYLQKGQNLCGLTYSAFFPM